MSNPTTMQKLQTTFIEKRSEVPAEKYYEMLECLPPERMAFGGFLVGEASDHNSEGEPRYALYIQENGNFYYCGLATTKEFDTFVIPIAETIV